VKSIKKWHNKPFTLLEIMLALVILSLIASFSAIHIKKLIDDHVFEREVSELYIRLQEAQLLALTYQTDIALDFYVKNGKLHYKFTTNEPFKPSIKFDQVEKKIHAALIQFNGKKIVPLHFDLFSGRLEPRGILTFFQTKEQEGKKLWFDLQYGHLIHFAYSKPILFKQQLPGQK
jgi:prepilin-type N-terminal cleavage/methylation domain-containing protein